MPPQTPLETPLSRARGVMRRRAEVAAQRAAEDLARQAELDDAARQRRDYLGLDERGMPKPRGGDINLDQTTPDQFMHPLMDPNSWSDISSLHSEAQKPAPMPAAAPAPVPAAPSAPEYPYSSRVGELDALEAMYNENPDEYMRTHLVAQDDKGTMGLHPQEDMRQWREDVTGRGFTEYAPGVAYKLPEGMTLEKGSGSVSMLSGSPEAEARVTQASRMEDMQQAIDEARMKEMAADPLGIKRQQALAANDVAKAVAIEKGKIGAQTEARGNLRDEYASEQEYYANLARQREDEVRNSNLPEAEKEARIAQIQQRAEELQRNIREAYGFSERMSAGLKEQ